jgi:hypothetical protein
VECRLEHHADDFAQLAIHHVQHDPAARLGRNGGLRALERRAEKRAGAALDDPLHGLAFVGRRQAQRGRCGPRTRQRLSRRWRRGWPVIARLGPCLAAGQGRGDYGEDQRG